MANSLTSQDFLVGFDFTSVVNANGTDLNQSVDLALPISNLISQEIGKGIMITTHDTAANVPDVPNPSQSVDYNKWKRYLWNRVPHATAASPKPTLYTWNSNQGNSDPTLLNWWDTSADLTQIEADLAAALTNSEDALNTATTALTTANDANTAATAAQTAATTAQATASAAQTAATTATTNSQSALTSAATATASATAAQGTATNAATAAAAAQVSANSALSQLATKRSVKFKTGGNYKWIAPTGVNSVLVKCLGAGGGGSSALNPGSGGGGGGGEYAEKTIPVVPGTVYPLSVGAGGTHDVAGTKSNFINDATVLANGGAQGLTGGAPGAGGSGGVGDIHFNGFDGYNGFDANIPSGGGNAAVGSAGGQRVLAAGVPGQGEGAGGSGGVGSNIGGVGQDGYVIIIFT